VVNSSATTEEFLLLKLSRPKRPGKRLVRLTRHLPVSELMREAFFFPMTLWHLLQWRIERASSCFAAWRRSTWNGGDLEWRLVLCAYTCSAEKSVSRRTGAPAPDVKKYFCQNELIPVSVIFSVRGTGIYLY
jgi:hypothetical protein